MKKTSLIRSILFSVIFNFCGNINAQEFAPIGAKWYYSMSNPSPYMPILYTTITSVGDTIIEGKICKILQKSSKTCSDTWSNEYLYSDSGIVYWYNRSINKFTTLYDFNTDVGDSFATIITAPSGNDTSSITIKIDSIGTFVLNNNTLKHLKVTITDSYGSYSGFRIIEKIGYIDYLFPNPYYNLVADCWDYHSGPLRCYEDTVLGFYQQWDSIPCDTTYYTKVGIQKINIKIFSSISPNPFSNSSTIEISNMQFIASNIKFLIYDVLGQLVHQQTLNSQLTILNLSQPGGIYFYLLKNEKEIIGNGKLVIQ